MRLLWLSIIVDYCCKIIIVDICLNCCLVRGLRSHAEGGEKFAVGGRVLNFVSLSDDFTNARKNIFDNILKLNWSGGFYRKDIGYKVID